MTPLILHITCSPLYSPAILFFYTTHRTLTLSSSPRPSPRSAPSPPLGTVAPTTVPALTPFTLARVTLVPPSRNHGRLHGPPPGLSDPPPPSTPSSPISISSEDSDVYPDWALFLSIRDRYYPDRDNLPPELTPAPLVIPLPSTGRRTSSGCARRLIAAGKSYRPATSLASWPRHSHLCLPD